MRTHSSRHVMYDSYTQDHVKGSSSERQLSDVSDTGLVTSTSADGGQVLAEVTANL